MRISAVKDFFFPKIDDETQRLVDEESTRNINFLSIAMAFVEFITLIVYISTRKNFGTQEWISVSSVAFCIVICLGGHLVTRYFVKKTQVSHNQVMFFKVAFFFLMSVWAIWTSYRQYLRHEQLLTFYSVELVIVCFIPLRPWMSAAFMGGVDVALYAILYFVDGADGVNGLNYMVFVFVSVCGMIIRFQSMVRMAEVTVRQRKTNDLLEYNSRHDGLTGLRNRVALDEDVPKVIGKHVTALMIDVNYFKEINDTHGHIIGDQVLRETAKMLKKLYPTGRCYRFGGDEFVVLCEDEEMYKEHSFRFTVSADQRIDVIMSIGYMEGTPEDYDQLFELIGMADESLYESKRKTHSPEYGGHDRRNRCPTQA